MPKGEHKAPVVGWHPSPPELVNRLRAAVKQRGGGRGAQTIILNQALRDWLDRNENSEEQA